MKKENYSRFLAYLQESVVSGRYETIFNINNELISLYHQVGTEILKSQEIHNCGTNIIDQLSHDLKSKFPPMLGFSFQNLLYMRKFAQDYPKTLIHEFIVQLPWSHHILLMDHVPSKHDRMFYMKKTIEHGWSRNILLVQIETTLHKLPKQSSLNKKLNLPSPQSNLANFILKDPYTSDFLYACKDDHQNF